MVNIFLCDDIPMQLHCVRDLVADYTQQISAQIFCFEAPADLLAALGETTPDIAVLDIDLGRDSGIELAKQLNAACPNCQIIFLTAYSDYASEVYFAEHAWFVLKKDITKYLVPALDKALDTLSGGFHDVPALWVRKRRSVEKIPVSEVLYLERRGHQTAIVRLHGTELCRQAPEDLLSAMRDNPFIRCHQSFWVNRAKIFSLVGSSFHLIDGSEVLISRSYRKEAVRLFEEAVLTPPASRRNAPV